MLECLLSNTVSSNNHVKKYKKTNLESVIICPLDNHITFGKGSPPARQNNTTAVSTGTVFDSGRTNKDGGPSKTLCMVKSQCKKLTIPITRR